MPLELRPRLAREALNLKVSVGLVPGQWTPVWAGWQRVLLQEEPAGVRVEPAVAAGPLEELGVEQPLLLEAAEPVVLAHLRLDVTSCQNPLP